MSEKFKIGYDLQVILKNEKWVKFREPKYKDCAYIGDGYISYLITPDFWGRSPTPDVAKCLRRIDRIGWKTILRAQEARDKLQS